jgi:flagellar hook-length control protein FliK
MKVENRGGAGAARQSVPDKADPKSKFAAVLKKKGLMEEAPGDAEDASPLSPESDEKPVAKKARGEAEFPKRAPEREKKTPEPHPVVQPQSDAPAPVSPTQEPDRPHAAADVEKIDRIVQEIAVTAHQGITQATVQLDSRTLEGLHIQIASQDGRLSIDFKTGSDSVKKLLDRNLEKLSAGLSSRNLRVSAIRVTSRSEDQPRI